MKVSKKGPNGFVSPTGLPENSTQATEWQEANRQWWETHPMRYDWKEAINAEEYSKEFYEAIDRRFFETSRDYFPIKAQPFDNLIDYEPLRSYDVLEIGVGNGSHAQLLASHSHSYTGIDITEYAVKSTSRRLATFGVPGQILRMDAETMDFEDATFDLVWSWGVIHHSANTPGIMKQIHRVLKKGGKTVTMVYYRSWWSYYVMGVLFGLWKGELWKEWSIHSSVQKWTDGAFARYYSLREWRDLLPPGMVVDRLFVCGPKTDVLPLPSGRLKTVLISRMPNSLGRLLASRFRMGSFLVCVSTKTGP